MIFWCTSVQFAQHAAIFNDLIDSAGTSHGDPALIHPFLNEISKDKRRSIDGDFDTGAAALHLAIRCGSVETVQLLLSHRAISPNSVHPPGSGVTALHLAASLGRADVVDLLLEQENINDSLVDSQGRTCKEVAKGKDVVRAIETISCLRQNSQ
ncbi:hypothetical protein MPER_10284, partial [Moniliophthora perniciosa FA553]